MLWLPAGVMPPASPAPAARLVTSFGIFTSCQCHQPLLAGQALELADDSDYGLVATVVSGDGERAERIAARIDAGHVWINSGQVIFPNTAWGGFKASGIGRELGPWGMGAYLGVKHLTIAGQGQP